MQTLPGRTVAFMTSDVRPQVGGIIQKRLFTEGEQVEAGQVLYQIDPASYQAAYDNARGTLAQADAGWAASFFQSPWPVAAHPLADLGHA